MEYVLTNAYKSISYENTNKAEVFMSILTKMHCGKYSILIQRHSFEIRSYLTALKYNEGNV